MESIIVKPKTAAEFDTVLGVLKKMKVKTEIIKDRTKEQILSSIEEGAKEAVAYLKGEKTLKSANQLLDEL